MEIYNMLVGIAKSGSLYLLNNNESFIRLNNFVSKCISNFENDNIIDQIFKAYIIMGKQSGALSLLNRDRVKIKIPNGSDGAVIINNDIDEAIVYHCASDFDLTIVAKMMFYSHCNPYFIDEQVNVLLQRRCINISAFYNSKDNELFNSHITTHGSLHNYGYEPWERNGFYQYDENGKLIIR